MTYTETVDGIKWTYTVSNGEASLGGGTYSSPAISISTSGAIAIPSKLGGYSVTSIGNYAFDNCSGLTSITMLDSVTSIGNHAFYRCSGLTSVAIPNTVTNIGSSAFSYCSGLTSVTIPDSVTSIGNSAFSGCSGLTNVAIPNTVTNIGYSAFSGCRGLTSVTIPDSVTNIGYSAFADCSGLTGVTIPDSVTSIGNSAFSGCSGLTGVTIPDSVTSIGNSAFSGCSGLTSVVIPNTVTSIGNSAFSGCSGLTSITIPLSVSTIGSDAFYGCSDELLDSTSILGCSLIDGCIVGITNNQETTSQEISCFWSVKNNNEHKFYRVKDGLVFTDSLKTLAGVVATPVYWSWTDGDECFASVSRNLLIPDGVEKIDGYFSFSHYPPDDCTVFPIVTVPASVKVNNGDFVDCEIGSLYIPNVEACCRGVLHGFSSASCQNVYIDNKNIKELQELIIPDGVDQICEYAFRDMNIKTLIISPSVTNICNNAFEYCSKLSELTIGDGVTSIGDSAFTGCSGLTSVTIPDSVTSIGRYAFSGCSGLMSISVGKGNVNYKSINGQLLSKDGKTLIVGVNGDVAIPDGVTSIGSSAFEGCSRLTSVTIPDSVTSIGNYAFWGCRGLTSVTIPDSVTNIGKNVFSYCNGLTRVNVGGGVTNIDARAFVECDSLISFSVANDNVAYSSLNGMLLSKDGKTLVAGINGDVVIPDGVTSIQDYAFSWHRGLTSVTIPSSVTNIGHNAFYCCYGLTSIKMIGDCPETDFRVNSSCVVYLPSGNGTYDVANGRWCGMRVEYYTPRGFPILTIVDGVLTEVDLNGAESVEIPDTVICIGDGVFTNCTDLTSVTIPETVTRIGANAFERCSMLTNVVMSGGVKRIEKYAFARCTALESIAIPEGVTFIDKFVFAYDTKLERVDLPDSVTNIGEAAFRQCKALKEIVLPANLPRVRRWAFSDCIALTNVTMNTGVASIESEAFSGCSALATIVIPDSVETIDSMAFYNCSKLMDVDMGSGVQSIGQGAFEYCESLKEIHISDLAAWCGISISTYTVCPFGAGYSLYLDGELVTDMAIPDGVEVIPYKIFDSCVSVTAVTMAGSVTNVGWSAFRNCTSMTNAVLGAGVKSISKCAFEGCESLKSVRLPSELESIGDYAFYGCTALEGIWFDGDAPSMGDGVFTNASAQTCAYVRRLSKGWGVDIPGAWNGIAISYVPVMKVETPVIIGESGLEFWSDSYTVTMSCKTEGAAIYYTDDGSTPRLQDEYLYTGPITITDTTTFKAVAVLDDMKSEYVIVTLTKRVPRFEDVLDSGDSVSYLTDGDVPWLPTFDDAAMMGGNCAKSAKIGDRTSTWLSASVSGAGTLSFWCKVSCEHDEDNSFSWDRLMVYTNDVEIVDWRMDGETDWTQRTITFDGGENIVKWVYFKDRVGSDGEDCGWVDAVVWKPSSSEVAVDVGGGKSVVVPNEWLAAHEEYVRSKGDDIDVALKSMSANGRLSVVECYLLGLDPEKSDDDFKITSFPMNTDGSPDLDSITFSPPQSQWNIQGAVPRLKGKANLSDQWQDVPPGGDPSLRFFTIAVELP